MCASQPGSIIQQQLKIFDWLVQRRDPKISKNPAGFLVSSIRNDYAAPKGFSTPVKSAGDVKQKVGFERQSKQRVDKEDAAQKMRLDAIRQFWQSLNKSERERLESEAIAAASKFERDVIERGGPFSEPMRKVLLDAYANKMLPHQVE